MKQMKREFAEWLLMVLLMTELWAIGSLAQLTRPWHFQTLVFGIALGTVAIIIINFSWFARTFAVTLILVPAYMMFELGLRPTWPGLPGASLYYIALTGFAVGLCIDAYRLFRRHRKRILETRIEREYVITDDEPPAGRNHTSSGLFHS